MSENKTSLNLQMWDIHELPLDQICFFKIGPLNLWIKRYSNEWRIISTNSDDIWDEGRMIEIPANNPPPEDIMPERFALKKTSDRVQFMPVLADRDFVIKPEHSFYIPAKDEATLWVTTGLWLHIQSYAKVKKILEIPLYRPSDTWFGQTPTKGEVCYFGKTVGKLRYDELNLTPNRAITKIRVQNQLEEPMLLERMKLPITNLSLFKSQKDLYFTDEICLIHEDINKPMKIRLDRPPQISGNKLEKVAKQRYPMKNLLDKTLHYLSNN